MSTAVDKYNINDKETFKIDVNGRTIGVFDFFARVRDNWDLILTILNSNLRNSTDTWLKENIEKMKY